MENSKTTQLDDPKRKRGGRPPATSVGEVDARILQAARKLFLLKGFDGTSCDQVAVVAGCGKASIYARYPDKGALFAGVVQNMIDLAIVAAHPSPGGGAPANRLIEVCTAVILASLTPEAVGMMRLMIAGAVQFPELAAQVNRVARDRAVAPIADVIAGGKGDPAIWEAAAAAAGCLVDAVFAPLQLRALLGEDLVELRLCVHDRVCIAVRAQSSI